MTVFTDIYRGGLRRSFAIVEERVSVRAIYLLIHRQKSFWSELPVRSCLLMALVLACSVALCAQADPDGADSSPAARELLTPDPPHVSLKALPRNLFQDQKDFWFTPFHLNRHQWELTVPLAFVGAGLLASDSAIQRHTPTDPTIRSHAAT